MTGAVSFDEHGLASLDGVWELLPGDHDLAALDTVEPLAVEVPGLWEAQGHLDLDGVAWYRRRLVLDDVDGWWWTLRLGAVMDVADLWLNGILLGSHDSPFTPFEVDPAPALVPGENVLAVRVFDPPVDDPEHARLAHGKQGWANHVFPSRPSLYMTYGGIWQGVTLRRHGPLVLRDLFVNGDPDDLVVTLEVDNRAAEPVPGRVSVRAVGLVHEAPVEVGPGATVTVEARLGATTAARWSPSEPVLHTAVADVLTGGGLSTSCSARFGLRTVRLEGERMLVCGQPYRMRSALVQGFRADSLYAEGTRAQIEEEVAAAKAMGFNTLRLHIKAFDPVYLDVCDEMGMLLECDIPVAEPIAHAELALGTVLTRRCLDAAREQVRRDRNHPSIVLWAAMNEVCLDGLEARDTPGYRDFVTAMVAAITEADPTRPVIENEWVEPDPGRVYVSPVLTAHWYGRLHAEYLDKIEGKAARWRGTGRPLFVTEFGDWGLPEMPALADPPFWDTRETYAAGLAGTLWPGTIGRFLIETHRYQGLSDRLQAEVFRRHDHIGGYCVTELTDVPHELNGLLDLHRRPKPMAVAEMTRANQEVLPMLALGSLVVAAGDVIRAPLHVANDGPDLAEVVVDARFSGSFASVGHEERAALRTASLGADELLATFGEWACEVPVGALAGFRAAPVGEVALAAPDVPGGHDLVLRLRAAGGVVAENRYPIHVVARPEARAPVRLLAPAGSPDAAALAALGATVGAAGPLLVGEGALDEGAAGQVRAELAAGATVVVLAQGVDAAPCWPVAVTVHPVGTEWGSSVFHFTTDHPGLPSLPRRAVLVAEDSTVQAHSVVTSIDGRPFPEEAVVVAYKPVPGAVTGTIAGAHPVGGGRLVFCQYRLAARAAAGDAAGLALLADLVRWAIAPPLVPRREQVTKDDGRSLTYYSFAP